MTTAAAPVPYRQIALLDEAATAALASRLACVLRAGDVLLLSGPIGAGKTTFARALIRAATGNPDEEVPSPTFTLVQTYTTPESEIWHFDLYRLQDGHEVLELGLDEAMDHAITLIEWPERLGSLTPPDALVLTFRASDSGHGVTITAPAAWQARLEPALA